MSSAKSGDREPYALTAISAVLRSRAFMLSAYETAILLLPTASTPMSPISAPVLMSRGVGVTCALDHWRWVTYRRRRSSGIDTRNS